MLTTPMRFNKLYPTTDLTYGIIPGYYVLNVFETYTGEPSTHTSPIVVDLSSLPITPLATRNTLTITSLISNVTMTGYGLAFDESKLSVVPTKVGNYLTFTFMNLLSYRMGCTGTCTLVYS